MKRAWSVVLPVVLAVLFTATAYGASCAGGVCVPWTDAPGAVRVGLRIVPAALAGGTITVESLADGRRWTLRAPGIEIERIRAMLLPPGSHVVTVELAHHRPATRRIEVPRGETFDAGTIAVARMPLIQGEVRTADGKALSGVSIALRPSGEATTTNASGEFAIDVAGEWPSAVLVTHPGFEKRVVRLGGTEGDVTLPLITLRRRHGRIDK